MLPPDQIDAITKAKRLVFHTDGDLGGIKDAVPQERVAQGIEEDFYSQPADPSTNPFSGISHGVAAHYPAAEWLRRKLPLKRTVGACFPWTSDRVARAQ